MSEVETFQCPRCNGPLEITDGDEKSVVCPYCGSRVVVPEHLRAHKPEPSQPVVVTFDQMSSAAPAARAGSAGCSIGAIVAIVAVLVIVVAGAAAFFLISSRSSAVSEAIEVVEEVQPEMAEIVGETPGPSFGGDTPVPSFGSQTMAFGSEGIGPGLFTDARHVAVDGEGNIYVGEYQDGRVQRFDPAGKFLSQWSVDTEFPLRALAADRTGVVYVVQRGEIHRYDGQSGQLLGTVAYGGGTGFDDVVVAADGGLVAAWYSNRDDIVRFDAQGNVALTIQEAISGQSGDSELNTRVAVDGLGNIYALGTFNNAVFKFAPGGRYVNRFGGDGDAPGQFRAPGAIAVDGRGRVYVSDIKGIQVFDSDGRYVDTIDVDGAASGMAFDDAGHLLVAVRDHVVQFDVSPD